MILKKTAFILFIFIILFNINPSENQEKNNKKKSIKVYFESETSTEIELLDSNDTDIVKIILNRNTPFLGEELELFLKIRDLVNKNFIFGPYIYTDFEGRFDYRGYDLGTIFLERFYGDIHSGVKIGYRFKKKKVFDSSIVCFLPVAVENNLLFHESNSILLPDPSSDYGPNVYDEETDEKFDLRKFHTSLRLGTQLGFHYNLKISKLFMRFDLENYLDLRQDLLKENFEISDYSGFYLKNSNIIEYSILPFNFINKKIDLSFILYNRFRLYYDSYNIRLKDKLYFGMEWTGFKYLHLMFKPIQYRYDVKIPTDKPASAYDQKHMISMELTIGSGYKFFWFEAVYEPVIFASDSPKSFSDVNKDSIKPHKLTFNLIFKIG